MSGLLLGLMLAAHPAAVNAMVVVTQPGTRGWGVPLSPHHVATMAHLVDAGGDVFVSDARANPKPAMILRINKDKDVALLLVLGLDMTSVRICKALPQAGDTVHWRVILPHGGDSFARGQVLGLDADNTLLVDGWFHPGTSGSGVINEAGELVGLVRGGVNQGAQAEDYPQNLAGALTMLFRRTFVPPAMGVVPVVGNWP